MEMLNNISMEDLQQLPVKGEMKKAIDIFVKVQKNLIALANNEDEQAFFDLKVGTVVAIAVADKLLDPNRPAEERNIKALKKEEWEEIAKAVSKIVILEEEQTYSEYVFKLYANYIGVSAEVVRSVAGDTVANAVKGLAEEILRKSEELENGIISEVKYVEDCLWISLEAMVKLLSSYMTSFLGPEVSELAQAASMFAFEYGRLMLYKKEQAVLTLYLEQQKELDATLQKQYDEYMEELNQKAEEFQVLVRNAFEPDFRDTFMNSAKLAEACGVREEEILKTVEDVDDFFM